FDCWRGITGQDLDSACRDPQFRDTRRRGFRLAASSPALHREEWKPLGDDGLARIRRELSPGLLGYAEKLQKLRGSSAPVELPGEPRAVAILS
ncbi:MAG: hypothetical protein WCP21_06425, partial [Armatimonadota bacterium]